MEQNQTPLQPQVKSNKTHLLLFILLMVTSLFSAAVVMNYQFQQAELEAELDEMTTQTLIRKASPVSSNVKISNSKDIGDIDIGSIEADMQEIRNELKGL